MPPPLRVGVDVLNIVSRHGQSSHSLCPVAYAWLYCSSAARFASTAITPSGHSTSPTSLTRSPANLGPRNIPEPSTPHPNTRPTQIQIKQQRVRSRGGQNLTERWARLERSLRGKEGYEAKIDTLIDQVDHISTNATSSTTHPRTFHGLLLPERPSEPQSDGKPTPSSQGSHCM